MVERPTTLFFAMAFLVSGCAAQRPAQIEPPIYMTHQEFASGIVFPAFQLLTALGSYYVEEGKVPNRNELETHASKFREPIDWQRFSGLEVSEIDQEIVMRVNINSTNQTEHVTSWKFFLKKSSQQTQSLQFSVLPQSHLCVRGKRTVNDVMVGLFLNFAVSYLTKTTVSTASTVNPEFCFHPSSGRANAPNERMQRKLEYMKKKMQDKQQSREKAPSS